MLVLLCEECEGTNLELEALARGGEPDKGEGEYVGGAGEFGFGVKSSGGDGSFGEDLSVSVTGVLRESDQGERESSLDDCDIDSPGSDRLNREVLDWGFRPGMWMRGWDLAGCRISTCDPVPAGFEDGPG